MTIKNKSKNKSELIKLKIQISKGTAKKLRIIKLEKDFKSYDEVINYLYELKDGANSNDKTKS